MKEELRNEVMRSQNVAGRSTEMRREREEGGGAQDGGQRRNEDLRRQIEDEACMRTIPTDGKNHKLCCWELEY